MTITRKYTLGGSLSLPQEQANSVAVAPMRPLPIGRELTPEEQQIVRAMERQSLIIASTGAREEYGINVITKMHAHGVQAFEQAAADIMAVREGQRGLRSKEHQTWVELYTDRAMELMGTTILAAVDVASQNILVEVGRSLDLRPEKRRRTLWEVLTSSAADLR
jgi:hypothetical protein